MGNIHFYLGAKGGVGKTLLALSTLYSCQEQNQNCVLIDINFNNPDLFYSYVPYIDDTELVRVGRGYAAFPLKAPNIKKCALIVAHPGGAKFGKLPYRGIYQIFKDIDDILSDLKKEAVLKSLGLDSLDQILVDTGMHLSNMKTTAEERHFDDWEGIKNIKEFHPIVWFIWVYAIVNRGAEAAASLDAVNWLEEISGINGEKWFDQKRNLIHVINPPAFFSTTWKPSERRKLDRRIFNPLLNFSLSERSLTESLDFKNFFQSLLDIKKFVESGTISTLDFCSLLVSKFSTNENTRKNVATQFGNIFILPYYFTDLDGYINHLGSENEQNGQTQREKIFVISELLKKFLEETKI